jgi:hypothetical protein
LRISTPTNGPSLAEVLAFTMLENADDVARVERAAANRMSKVRGWVGWCVAALDVAEDADGLVRITVHAEPVGAEYREKAQFEFLTDMAGQRRSSRLDAFLRACGIRERCDDTREVEGRHFATRNGGRTAVDFGPLTRSLV